MFIEVQHWSGAGNRFVIIDDRQKRIEQPWNALVPSLCQRKELPDAEGVLVLLQLDRENASCNYQFYNPDSSTGVMCGNGARCAVQYAVITENFDGKKVQLILNQRPYTAQVTGDDRVALRLPLYKELRLIDSWTYVNVGSHHVVIDARDLVQSIDDFHHFDLIQFAKENLDFYRTKTGIPNLNLNFAYPVPDQSLVHLRTYENGVFDETQACGTGAVSTAIAFWTRNIIRNAKIQLNPTSQRVLIVHLEIDEQKNISGMILEGDARQDAPPGQFDPSTMKYQ